MTAIFRPLFLSLLKTIHQMNIVFHSRGLDIEARERTRLRDVPLTRLDFIAMIVLVAVTALVFGLWSLGYIRFAMG
jgi:energy-coupling factor transporter transmembrane protein EcfT